MIYDIYAARENLADFDFSRRGDNIHNIKNSEMLLQKTCGGTYTEDRDTIKQNIDSSKDDTIVVVYSAGDIDYDIRQHIELC